MGTGAPTVEAAGLADVEHSIPIDGASRFHLASIAKQFTAFAAALMIESGDVDVDAPITQYLEDIPAGLARCRVRHLIFHTSGLRDQWVLASLSGVRSGDRVSTDDVLRFVRIDEGLNFEPGAAFRYSNTGYTLLGTILERVTGEPFAVLIDRLVFSPAAMTAQWCTDPEQIFTRRVRAYREENHLRRLYEPRYGVIGSTGLRASAQDMIHWNAFLQARTGVPDAVFRRFDSLGALDDGTPIPYGYGQFGQDNETQRIRFHGGYDYGFNAMFVRELGGQGLAAFGAANGAFPAIEGIARSLVAPVPAQPAAALPAARGDLTPGAYADLDRRDVRVIRLRENGNLWLDWMQGFELERRGSGVFIAGSEVQLSTQGADLTISDGRSTVCLSAVPDISDITPFLGLYANASLGSIVSVFIRNGVPHVATGSDAGVPAETLGRGLLVWRGMWATIDPAGQALRISHPRALGVEFRRFG